ncbi:MFS transporter [Pseudothauera nasutitermitis]|uniref:MFS transporter n=1 Tax=Pseudothauera nasutitermitis TaxID=2565930 RepID=A0A4S4ASH4_9RHOO|nr:MFS transporter [Pseudothauera nasutitermitis]THF62813.1 MFS transporter [Pseudothauera nasutitermitis]
MLPLLLPIGALLAGIALMLTGTGLLNTLLALRGSVEGFSDQTLGLIGSAYFVGFFAGTFVAPPLIRRMGHVRAFAFFGAATAACVLAHALLAEAWFWMLLRVITGIALVGFYTVIESWLNSQAPGERRGQIFAIYMAVNLFALAGAQQFLHLAAPAAFTLFAVAAISVMLALMPVMATRLPPPPLTDTPRLPIRRLWEAAPVAIGGALASGLAMGAFWGLGAVYAGRIGLPADGVATFISLTILAGALLQWPIGRLSDSMDRRYALALVAAVAAAGGVMMAILGNFGLAVLVGCAIFGAAAFAVYPVVVAHLIDHLHHDEILSGNAGLLLVHGAAAAVGPALAGVLMDWIGPAALPLYFAAMFAPAAAFALLQARRGADEIVDDPAQFMPMLRTSPTVLEMMNPPEAAPPEAPAATHAD